MRATGQGLSAKNALDRAKHFIGDERNRSRARGRGDARGQSCTERSGVVAGITLGIDAGHRRRVGEPHRPYCSHRRCCVLLSSHRSHACLGGRGRCRKSRLELRQHGALERYVLSKPVSDSSTRLQWPQLVNNKVRVPKARCDTLACTL
eukprot:Amastigsp_a5351_7.p2 type:complete len:149 gc:universal Amastigsp_a5351_7:134-580(+)